MNTEINCELCGAVNDRTKDGRPCIEIDGKGACRQCFINACNRDSEEFGEEEEDNYDEDNLCYHCGCYLDENTHIFIFEKLGCEDITMCAECGNDNADEMREDGYKRDDDEDDVQR
jgi:hypothetical protein